MSTVEHLVSKLILPEKCDNAARELFRRKNDSKNSSSSMAFTNHYNNSRHQNYIDLWHIISTHTHPVRLDSSLQHPEFVPMRGFMSIHSSFFLTCSNAILFVLISQYKKQDTTIRVPSTFEPWSFKSPGAWK